jgi:hypothetical protein
MASLDDNLLRKMYSVDMMNDYQVAKLLHIGRNALRDWRLANGVPSKTTKKGLTSDICLEVVQRAEAGETVTRIAVDYNVQGSSLRKLLKKNGHIVPEYRPRHPGWVETYVLTDIQREVLLGEMFGDGGLVSTGGRSAYYHCGHAIKQSEFVAWKAAIFAPLTSRHVISKSRQTVTMGTWTCPDLHEWHKAFYPNASGHKVLTSSWARMLTPLALTVWYMGDGSRNRNTGVFHVGLQIETAPEIASALSEVFDLEFTARRYEREWHIRVMEPGKFFSIVTPLLLPSFGYKVPEAYRHLVGNQQPSLGENPSEGSTTRPIPNVSFETMDESPAEISSVDAEHPSHVG